MHEESKETPVLVVMAPGPLCAELIGGLKALGLKPWNALSYRAARHSLQKTPAIEVVVTAATLSDGNWSDLLQYIVRSGSPASVILYCPEVDEILWLEAIGRGVDDVLAAPFDPKEFQRAVERARQRRLQTDRLGLPFPRGKAELPLLLTPGSRAGCR